MYLVKGDLETAIISLERSQKICESSEIRVLTTQVGSNLGYAYALSGRLNDGIPLLEKANEQSEAIGRKGGWALRLTWLAHASLLEGRLSAAREHCQRALALAGAGGERGYQAWALKVLGDIVQEEAAGPSEALDHYSASMRVIRLGGESVSWRDVELYRKHFSDACVLANELSCSETNTFSQFLLNKQTEFNRTVPVGYSVEDKDVIILDQNGNLVDDGDIGEIAIRSRYLSPGYWNRSDLTDLAFMSDPESATSRIYRTGDLGRKSADGCLEHLGRKDARVKIRGYRVECNEIELALLQSPTVNQAFVTHRQDSQNESYLIAYVVCAKRPTFNVSDLRADLSQRLPSYMVPASFVFLDDLPLTPTGKIDRSALPVPDSTRSALQECYEPPRNEIEKSVANICSEILNISTIGVRDNLFDLGGHSLSAMS